jgi:hypothetical protein
MKNSRANKGQFSIIAALLVSVILVTAVISTYSMVRHTPIQESPKVLTAMGEMNTDIKRILDHTVGYYGSILKVTGNSTYAQNLTNSYLSSGLVYIAHSHPEWNPSFSLNFEQVSTRWYMPESYSVGNISLTYSLSSLGIEGVTYETSSALKVTMLSSGSGVAQIKVIRENAEPELGLSKKNFWFYKYDYDDSTWELVNPTNLIISSSGVYSLTIPSGVDQDAYSVQVEDNRGIIVTAFYSQNSVISGIPHYTYNFNWTFNGMQTIYDSLSTDTIVIELLQNGTLTWLGQNLELAPQTKPIPPIAIKGLHVNATINSVNQEVAFQVENWASSYRIPLGLAGNESLFNNNNMLVFLVNNAISDITLWWDGNDRATQTSYAWENVYFNDAPSSGILRNGFLRLDIITSDSNFYVESRVINKSNNYRADFIRVNDELPTYGAQPAYVIYNGIIRDIIQQEPEYINGVSGCPNFYSQVFLTLPANTPYYTFNTRTIFVDSSLSRNVFDLSAIQISGLSGTLLTEDGTDGVYPETSTSPGVFYNSSATNWDHHWSQISSGNSGAGIMFTNLYNQKLYAFDPLVDNKTGALNITASRIEFNPVERISVSPFKFPLDLTWQGAVVTFDGEPIYPSSGNVGLWVMVEYPPSVTVD